MGDPVASNPLFARQKLRATLEQNSVRLLSFSTERDSDPQCPPEFQRIAIGHGQVSVYIPIILVLPHLTEFGGRWRQHRLPARILLELLLLGQSPYRRAASRLVAFPTAILPSLAALPSTSADRNTG